MGKNKNKDKPDISKQKKEETKQPVPQATTPEPAKPQIAPVITPAATQPPATNAKPPQTNQVPPASVPSLTAAKDSTKTDPKVQAPPAKVDLKVQTPIVKPQDNKTPPATQAKPEDKKAADPKPTAAQQKPVTPAPASQASKQDKPPVTAAPAMPAAKKEEEKGNFKMAGGKLPPPPDPKDTKPAFDTSKGLFGATKTIDTSKEFGNKKPFDTTQGFGGGGIDTKKGFGGTTAQNQPSGAKFAASGFPAKSTDKPQNPWASFADVMKNTYETPVQPKPEVVKPLLLSAEEQKKQDKKKKEEEKKKQVKPTLNPVTVNVPPSLNQKTPPPAKPTTDSPFKPPNQVQQSPQLTAQELAKKQVEDDLAKQKAKLQAQKDDDVVIQQEDDDNLEINLEQIKYFEEQIQKSLEIPAAIVGNTEAEQMAYLQKLIQEEEDLLKAENQKMEQQKKITRRRMTELAEIQLDDFLVESKKKNKNLDHVISLKKALKEDQKHHEALKSLVDLQVEKDQFVFQGLTKEKAENQKKLDELEQEVKDFQKYIFVLKPEVEQQISVNDGLCNQQSDFLENPQQGLKNHVQDLTKQSEAWLEANGYGPILDTDIKKWEFAEQERLEKLKFSQSQKDEMLNTMDSRKKISEKKESYNELTQQLTAIEHKSKLLQEDTVDLNQLEQEMIGLLQRCGVSYNHVVTTKYYPKRRHLNWMNVK